MAIEPDNWNDVPIPSGRPRGGAREKSKRHEDMYLCVALVVLLAWALYVGLGAVNW